MKRKLDNSARSIIVHRYRRFNNKIKLSYSISSARIIFNTVFHIICSALKQHASRVVCRSCATTFLTFFNIKIAFLDNNVSAVLLCRDNHFVPYL